MRIHNTYDTYKKGTEVEVENVRVRAVPANG